ncbi:MAG: hemerythrin domain-containing protein [Myxococcales bacterium]|nr:hemerythrin domain-containing protein [Myxococcales bacterium]
MDAIELLRKQHREVRDLFDEYQEAEDPSEKQDLFVQIADEISAHAAIEERLFYPAVYVGEMTELLEEAVEEHLGLKRSIADLLDLDAADRQFDAKMRRLAEQLERHVETEEQELFPKVRRQFSREELGELGEEMGALYEELREGEPRLELPRQLEEAPSLV